MILDNSWNSLIILENPLYNLYIILNNWFSRQAAAQDEEVKGGRKCIDKVAHHLITNITFFSCNFTIFQAHHSFIHPALSFLICGQYQRHHFCHFPRWWWWKWQNMTTWSPATIPMTRGQHLNQSPFTTLEQITHHYEKHHDFYFQMPHIVCDQLWLTARRRVRREFQKGKNCEKFRKGKGSKRVLKMIWTESIRRTV